MHTESHDRNGWIDEPCYQRKNSRIRSWAIAAAVSWLIIGMGIAGALALSGCDAPSVATTDAKLAEATAQLADAKTKAKEAEAAAVAAGDEGAAAKARATAALADEWAAKLADAQAALHAATGPDGTITPAGVAGAAAPFLPPPWNLLLGIGGTLAAGLIQEWRVRQKKQAAESIIDGIEAAKAASPAFKDALKANAGVLGAVYTDKASAMIEDRFPTAKPSNV